eukprot:3941150-Rhodomonas_salina.2
MSGTGVAYGLRACYVMALARSVVRPSSLRACYGRYDCGCYAMLGTDMPYPAPLSPYTRATRCPVLT